MDDYLFSRKNSPFFYYRLQNPPRMAAVLGWKVKVKSTGERDHHRALQVALADIIEHKKLLAATKAHDLQASGRIYAEREFQPNEERFGDDGSKAVCTNDGLQVVHTDASGRVNVRPNPTVTHLKLINRESEASQIEVLERLHAKPNRDIDEEIFQHWAKGKSTGNQAVVRKFMRTLHQIAPNRTLATLDVRDVRALEAKLVEEGNASTSLHSKFGLASAMVNAALNHEHFPMLKTNPFKVKGLQTQGIKGRRPENKLFDDDDFARIARDLPNWPDDLRLYWTMLRTMGGRRSEPTQVIGEETVSGYRCVEYGTKDETTRRVMPMPEAVLTLLGERRINGPLFKYDPDYMAKRIKDRLASLGIPEDSGKTLQSLRAGLDTELGRKGVSAKVVDTILGHVPDDMQGNTDGNQSARAKKSIKWRYFRGMDPKTLFDAMALVDSGL